MIYQLMRRDPFWKFLPNMVLVSAVAGGFAAAYPAPLRFFFPGIGFGLMFFCRPNVRATRFEATLPASGRQLFLARMSFMMAMIWLPAGAVAAGLLICGGAAERAVAMAAAAAVFTLAIAAVQSVRVREIDVFPTPNALLLASLWVPVVAAGLVIHSNATVPALLICAPLSAALFLRTLGAAPKAFQIAPEAASTGRATARVGGEPITARMAFPRSVFSWQSGFWLLYGCWQATTGEWAATCCFWLPMLWMSARQRVGWVRTLPIRPRVVLWTILAPPFLVLVLARLASFHLGRHRPPVPAPRDLALNIAAALAWALMVALLCALYDWRRVRHVSRVVRRVLLAVLLGAPTVTEFLLLLQKPAETTLIPNALLRLSQALPGNLAAVILFAALPVAALGWAVQRVYEEAEYAGR